MALPAVLLKAKNAISKGSKVAKTAKTLKNATSNSNEEEVKSFFGILKVPLFFVALSLLPLLLFMIVIMILLVGFPSVLYGAEYGSDSASGSGSIYTGDIAYLQWAIDIANDDTHGYSQCARTGPDYDCSSLVYYSLLNTGYTEEQLGSYPFNTSTQPRILSSVGFERHMYVESELQAGDILWIDGHTGIYAGDGQVVQASSSREGNGLCGATGDKTGTEIWVSQNTGNWTYYYRKEG